MKIPTEISKAMSHYREYKGRIRYLGIYKDSFAFDYEFHEEVELGLPIVYLYKDSQVSEVYGSESFEIINLLVKD